MGWELFSQYVRALHEAKPKFFIYENNKSMAKAIYQSISETFGFEPIMINSALVSAQNRQRLYWIGKRNADGTYSKVDIRQPEDRGILLKDVLDSVTDRDKGRAVIGSIGRTTEREYFKKNQGNISFEPVGITKDGKAYVLKAGYSNGSGENIGNYAAHTLKKGCKSMVAEPVNVTAEGKAQCLRATCYKDGIRNIVGNIIDRKTGVAEPVNTTVDGKSQTIKAQYSNTDINNICKYSSTFGASGVAEPVDKSIRVGIYPTSDGRLLNSQGMRIYSVDGKSITQSAQGGGMGAKTGLYAIPVKESKTVLNGIDNIYKKIGYVPEMFNAYNVREITDKSPTLTTGSMETSNCATNRFESIDGYAIPVEFQNGVPAKAVSVADSKTYKVYEVKDRQITIKNKQYPIKLIDGYYIIRKLTVSECKRLQTVPEWYEFPVSNTQSYRMLGNGWTCDVITHLIKATLK